MRSNALFGGLIYFLFNFDALGAFVFCDDWQCHGDFVDMISDHGIEILKLLLPLYWYDHYQIKISTADFRFATYSLQLRYASDFVNLKDFSFRIRLLLYIM